MNTYRNISLSILSCFFIVLSSCNDGKNAISGDKEEEVLPADIVELRGDQIKLAGIETGKIANLSLSNTLKVNGTVAVAPQNLATVCAPLGGFVKSTFLMPGNAIHKGQTLAVLENQEFVDIQQNYLEAKSRLEFAEAEYKRHSELYEADVYSKMNMQQVKAEYLSLKAQTRALEQKLMLIGIDPDKLNEDNISSSLALTSPINGYVKSVNVNIGKYVSPSDVLFEIENNDKLFLELILFEKDANKVFTGQKIRFFINNEKEQHDAVIYQTGSSIGPDRTYKVYARVEGNCKSVLPGMYVNAIIETSGEMVTALPSEAIVSFEDRDYIFAYVRDKEESGNPFCEYRMIEVQKGLSDQGNTEVILPEGFDMKNTLVVVKGAYKLLASKMNAGDMAC